MKEILIATHQLPGYTVSTFQRGTERLHRVQVTGPISINERINLYVKILSTMASNNFYCIVDNSTGYENNFSYQDMKLLDDMLIEYGVKNFYGATITPDRHYHILVDVANQHANNIGLNCELISTDNHEEAEKFIDKHIQQQSGKNILGKDANEVDGADKLHR